MPGAWVRCARLHAADGAPMPTKHTSSFFSARAAATVIISAALWTSVMADLALPALAGMDAERFRAFGQDILLHPGEEALPLARDRVPGDVIGVVAHVVALGIGRMGAAGDDRDGADDP